MRLTVDINDDELIEHIEQMLLDADQEDPLGTPLSIIFSGEQPELFFCPCWQVKYEARVSLKKALQTELDDIKDDEPEKTVILKRLIAVLKS